MVYNDEDNTSAEEQSFKPVNEDELDELGQFGSEEEINDFGADEEEQSY